VIPELRAALAIAGREVRGTYGSAYGYGLTAGFVAMAGVLLVLALRAGEARLDGWFAPLFVLIGALVPLLTMRAFAEEERTGSLELLLTAPLRPATVVAGKLLGVLAVLAVLGVATLTAPLLVAALGAPDPGPIVTGYVGFALLGVAFCAVGLAASASTGNQLVAASLAAAVLLGLWFGAGVTEGLGGRLGRTLSYLSPSTHVTGFLRGTIALVDVVYFASFAVLGVWWALAALRTRR
jgi:ABC-2 type transport system permease protein